MIEVEAAVNTSALKIIRSTGRPIETACDGRGVCGRCRIELGAGEYLVNGKPLSVKPGEWVSALACLTTLAESPSWSIRLPEELGEIRGVAHFTEKIDTDFNPLRRDAGALGMAVDIGTTTVALLIMDLSDGSVIGRGTALNAQAELADDVASRISRIAADEKALDELRALVAETINRLAAETAAEAGVDLNDIKAIVIAGNTVMTHIFFGVSPVSIGVSPFTPVFLEREPGSAVDFGLNAAPSATLWTLPAISGYIGGDIVADLLVSELGGSGGVEVLIDIGTNCEIVLFDGKDFWAGSAAAGPAFEGAGVSRGVRAVPGAIEKFGLDEDSRPVVELIPGANRPVGVCGSAIVDFIAHAFDKGMINQAGRFDKDKLAKAGLMVETPVGAACRLIENIFITERDIEQILKAKAAVYGGLKSMVEDRGLEFSDIKRVLLAGGFANHVDIVNAMAIGMLPELPLAVFKIVGNGALAGAASILLNRGLVDTAKSVAATPKAAPLNQSPGFENNFIDALMIPNYDKSLFKGQKPR